MVSILFHVKPIRLQTCYSNLKFVFQASIFLIFENSYPRTDQIQISYHLLEKTTHYFQDFRIGNWSKFKNTVVLN